MTGDGAGPCGMYQQAFQAPSLFTKTLRGGWVGLSVGGRRREPVHGSKSGGGGSRAYSRWWGGVSPERGGVAY